MALERSFRARPLFLTGESYAGKYIPAAAKHILDANDRLLPMGQRVNLQGIVIGNGMINAKQKATVEAMQNRTAAARGCCCSRACSTCTARRRG